MELYTCTQFVQSEAEFSTHCTLHRMRYKDVTEPRIGHFASGSTNPPTDPLDFATYTSRQTRGWLRLPFYDANEPSLPTAPQTQFLALRFPDAGVEDVNIGRKALSLYEIEVYTAAATHD